MTLHLWQRKGVWWYSRTIPEDVRGVIGVGSYWRFSLKTSSLREAEALRSEWDTKHQAEIDQIRRMTGHQKLSAIRSQRPRKPTLKKATAAPYEPEDGVLDLIDTEDTPDRGFIIRRTAAKKIAGANKWQLAEPRGQTEAARKEFDQLERALLSDAANRIHSLTAQERKAIDRQGGLENFYRQVVKEARQRSVGKELFGTPDLGDEQKEIRRTGGDARLSQHIATLQKLGLEVVGHDATPESDTNPRIRTALETFLKKKSRAASTSVKYRLHINRLADFTGNPTVKELTDDKLAEFVKAYEELPNSRALSPKQRSISMRELLAIRQRDPSIPALGKISVIKMCDYLKAFLKFIKRNDLRLIVEKPEDDRPEAEQDEGYTSFSPTDMKRLLPAVDSRFGKGSDTAWWVWLMAYSGCRPEEAAQLDRANVTKKGKIWTLRIDDLNGRRVKNKISHREVPIHPLLIKNGFPEFAHPKGSTNGLLFQSFERDDKGGRSNNPSRRLKRLLDILDIKGAGSAHRFRATFIDAVRNAALPYEVALALTGHSDRISRHHGGYGEGAGLAIQAQLIGRVDPLADPPLEYGPEGG